MTKKELAEFLSSISKSTASRRNEAATVLHEKKDLLIEEYYHLEDACLKRYQDEFKRIIQRKKCWDEKKCEACGSSLRIANSQYGEFWGCPNYSDKSIKHTTFSPAEEDYISNRISAHQVRVDANWLTGILRKCQLDKIATSTDLLNLYEELGLEDLREKYGYRTTRDRISGYVKAKMASSQEEREISNHLCKVFTKHNIQTGILYKVVGQPEKVAIIDLIVSDQMQVFIIEIKRSVLDIKSEQLELYHSLVSFILKNAKDNRYCRSVFIVYNKMEPHFSVDEKHLLFENIKEETSCSNLARIFELNAFNVV